MHICAINYSSYIVFYRQTEVYVCTRWNREHARPNRREARMGKRSFEGIVRYRSSSTRQSGFRQFHRKISNQGFSNHLLLPFRDTAKPSVLSPQRSNRKIFYGINDSFRKHDSRTLHFRLKIKILFRTFIKPIRNFFVYFLMNVTIYGIKLTEVS